MSKTHTCAPANQKYPVGTKLRLSGEDWTVLGHDGVFYTMMIRSDGEERTVSTMSIFHGLQETERSDRR